MKPRILIFDIETCPNRGWIWQLWNEITSYDFIENDWFILCWCAKWLGEKKIMSSALPDFKEYKKDKENDKKVLLALHKLLDEADIVVAHNGIKFDRKKVNTRFLLNGIPPPSPYRIVDTLQVARAHFSFISNRLDVIARLLDIGCKLDNGGIQRWKDCVAGISQAWKDMVKYCKKDVELLEKVYLALRPYMSQHPNLSVFSEGETPVCPKCASPDIWWRGSYFTNAGEYKRFSCKDSTCGGWGRLKKNLLPLQKRKTLTTHAV